MIERLRKWFRKRSSPKLTGPTDRILFLEKKLGFQIPPEDRDLFLKALRHRSIVEGDLYKAHETYERLEFLGDAVLDLIVTEILFDKYPTENEGFLTKLRAKVVRGDSLFEMARQLELNRALEIGDRASGQGIELSKSVLADVYEAFVAAIYISQGYEKVYEFVLSNINRFIDLEKIENKIDNHKSILMEYSQSHKLPLPRYEVINEEGPGHNKTFHVAVYLDRKELGMGTGKSKKQAEQVAAKIALDRLSKKN